MPPPEPRPQSEIPSVRPPATTWLRDLQPRPPVHELGPLQLAWLGDAVWELHQRQARCSVPRQAGSLHRAVVQVVHAEGQARALARLDPLLREEERELVRRGRNRAGRGPRRGEAAIYGRATGFETMLGWLFLQNPQRLAELLDHLDETESLPPPARP